MHNGNRYLEILREYWGYDSFRGIQQDIVESIGRGRDTLGLMPTGGGKSITFQVPALALEGVCIVITPLIALMKDQVEHLRQRGIQAAAVHAGITRQETLTILDNCILGSTKFLYIAPERIGSELFQNKLRRIRVSFITVDEAHCISQWGYDFRPSYLQIAEIRKLKPEAAVLALTATATAEVIDDIQHRLGFKAPNVFRMSFERRNLAYVVRETPDKQEQMVHILNSVPGSAIVYVRSRQRAADIARELEKRGITAAYYHAGLEHMTKDQRQKAWQEGAKRVMVATNAFGMGIDKPDVRVVIHIDCPSSIEAYFQEAGRAGRDGQKAYAVLLYNDSDTHKLQKRIADEFPEKRLVMDIYEHLACFYQIGVGSGEGHTFRFDLDVFSRNFRHFPTQVLSAMKILERAGYIEFDMDPNNRTRVKFILGRNELYMLREGQPNEEAVITALLRNYGGLFNEYGYIDETLIAQATGLTREQVYLTLKSLNRKSILHFIPQSRMPVITYMRDRCEKERMVLSREVYEQRKEEFEKRIKAITAYAMNNDVCRSRQLLRYFGEEKTRDCEICDVCNARNAHTPAKENARERALKAICNHLKDGRKHRLRELLELNLPKQPLDEALELLVHEETIGIDGHLIWLENGKLQVAGNKES
ncbi:MAG: ATP-dependent DNA helicase RecQ [Prevotella sp.]